MANVSSIMKQLKQERDRVERQLSGLNAALTAFAGVYRRQAEPQTAEDVSKESRQDSCCAATTLGQVQEVGQEVRVSVMYRGSPIGESRISRDAASD